MAKETRIKYIRVSTRHQSPARQEADAAQYDKVFIDTHSGKNADRPQLKAMLEYVREGDTVVVESYSRISRSTHDLLDILAQLERKGVAFVSQKERIDTSTPQGKLMMTVFAGLAQFERECMLERQAEGIAIAKSEGRMGRHKIEKPAQFDAVYTEWKSGKITAVAAMKRLGLKRCTFYKFAADEAKLLAGRDEAKLSASRAEAKQNAKAK